MARSFVSRAFRWREAISGRPRHVRSHRPDATFADSPPRAQRRHRHGPTLHALVQYRRWPLDRQTHPWRRRRESNPGRGFCRPLPSHSATSPRQEGGLPTALGADDRDRTGDLNLGKVALYQLSYVRRRAEATTATFERLCAGRAETTNPPRTHRQFIDDRELLGNDGDHDKLSDPIATHNGKRLLTQVD